jgi:hypothetical protein
VFPIVHAKSVDCFAVVVAQVLSSVTLPHTVQLRRRTRRFYVGPMFLLQLLARLFMHNNELINTDKTNNDAYITIEEISTYKLLFGLWIVPMHGHPNIKVMGFNPSTSLLQ